MEMMIHAGAIAITLTATVGLAIMVLRAWASWRVGLEEPAETQDDFTLSMRRNGHIWGDFRGDR